MNKKQAVAYAQIALNYMQSSKYKGVINSKALGIEMKQAFRLYTRDIVIDIAKAQIKASEKLIAIKNGCDVDEWK